MGYKKTGQWAKSKNLAEIMSSKYGGATGMARVRKRKTKNFGKIFEVEKWEKD